MENKEETKKQTIRLIHVLKIKNKLNCINIYPNTIEGFYNLIYGDYKELSNMCIEHPHYPYYLGDYFPIKGKTIYKKMYADKKLFYCWLAIRFLNIFSILEQKEIKDVIKYYFDALTFIEQ